MAPPRSTLSLIALLALFLPLLPSLANDVVIRECHNTENPEICETCVNSSSPPPETSVAVAIIVVSCLRARSVVLSAKMSDLAKATTNKTIRAVLLGCNRGYSQSVRTLARVGGSDLNNRSYDDANRSIRLTVETQLFCKESIEVYKVEIPDHVGYSMILCDELADGAMRIIDRLPNILT